MKNILKTALLLSLLLPVSTYAVVPVQPWYVTLDENGNGIAVTGTTTNILVGQLMADPSGGVAGNVLVYTLPFNFPAGNAGDYVLLEPTNYNTVSDVIRFWTTDNNPGNQVIFYSDINEGDPNPDLADTGLPASYLTLNVTLNEGGVEGGYQAVTHTAGALEPGYIGAGLGNYTFISDVPEPTSLGFMILGGLLGLRRLVCRKLS